MGKFVMWLVIGLVCYLGWRLSTLSQRRTTFGRVARDASRDASRELIVSCEVCAMHVPMSEALTVDGRHFCSVAHRNQALNRTSP